MGHVDVNRASRRAAYAGRMFGAARCLVLHAVCLIAVMAHGQPVDAASIARPNLILEYSDISDEQARGFADEAQRAYRTVARYFGRSDDRTILILVGNAYDVPTAYVERGTITLGANRVRGDAGWGRFAGLGPSIVHEITHLVAPSRGQNSNFLDEGLAVFVQEKFKAPDDRSFPNMGRDVHQETVRWSRETGRLVPLAEADPRRSRASGGRPLIYLQGGSFVRYLVETYGLGRFMAMYEGGTYQAAYGKGLDALEAEWRRFLDGVAVD